MGVLRSDRVSGLGGANAINGSAFFPQNTYINVEPDSGFNLSGDFTIEMWVRNLAGPEIGQYQRQIASKNYYTSGSDGNWYFGLNEFSTGELYFYSYDGQGSGESVSGNIATPDRDRWYHIAAARSGSTLKMFLDGSEEASGTTSKGLDDGGNNGLFIGGISKNKGTDSYGDHYGWISNLRIVKGRALYTADFTVPTGRLEKTSDTVLLCFQSPGDVLEEKTGKILSHNNHDTTGASKEVSADRLAPDIGDDHGTIFADNTKFDTLSYMVPPGGTTTQSNRGRGAFAMTAAYPNTNNSISYIDIASQGTAKDFGDLTAAGRYGCGNSSATRGVSGGALGRLTTMDYFTLATTGNALSFGTLTNNNWSQASVANSTRLIWISGNNPGSSPESNVNTMTYITIATTGNGTDFGDYTDGEKARYLGGNISSPTRGLAFGGHHDPNYTSNIDYVTIATTGNSQDYGDLSQVNSGCPGCSDSTRGVIFGGYGGPSPLAALNSIDYVTIATTGNATDFGDIPAAKAYGAACSNSIRGVHCVGGYPGTDNSMSYVTIQTTGNAQDFGDLPTGETGGDSCENNNFSDSHGGIS